MKAPVRRAVLASAFAVAISFSPMLGALRGPVSPGSLTAACGAGDIQDPSTVGCATGPAPNGDDGGFGAPSESQLTQCSGGDQGECLEGDLYPPAPVPQPDTSVEQSP